MVCTSSAKKSLKMRKLTPKSELPLRCASEGHCTFCSGESRAGTVHDIHNPGSAGLISGGIHFAVTVEPCLHQDLSFCLVFIQGCLPTSTATLLQWSCHCLPRWDSWHMLFVYSVGWIHNLLAWKLVWKVKSGLAFSFSKWDHLIYAYFYRIKGKAEN